jgi:hypothetical protein
MDYLNLFKPGTDLSQNASIRELRSIEGVGFINNQSGTVTLVLDHGANITLVAQKVKERFPDINVTARALLSITSDIEFKTQLGNKNVSVPFLLALDTEPNIDVGDNVTVSLVGIITGGTFAGNPVAKIIPTEREIVTNAVIKGVGDEYSAVIMLPWERRNINTSNIEGEFPASMKNVSVNYTASSFVVVKGLNSKGDDAIKKIGNLSYVKEVDGDIVYVKDDMNDSQKLWYDLGSILGNNTTVEYPVSAMGVQFSSINFSKEDVLKPTGGELVIHRRMFLGLGEKMRIAGVDYNVPSNTSFDVMLLNSYSLGQNVSIALDVGTIGKRIVELKLKNIVG